VLNISHHRNISDWAVVLFSQAVKGRAFAAEVDRGSPPAPTAVRIYRLAGCLILRWFC